jgi:F0F1-type ATP synthase assembly protein I
MVEEPKQTRPRRYQQGLNLGTMLVAGMVFCTMLGVLVDRKFDTLPFGTIGGIVLGFVYGGYEMWKEIRLPNPTIPNNDQQSDDE